MTPNGAYETEESFYTNGGHKRPQPEAQLQPHPLAGSVPDLCQTCANPLSPGDQGWLGRFGRIGLLVQLIGPLSSVMSERGAGIDWAARQRGL